MMERAVLYKVFTSLPFSESAPLSLRKSQVHAAHAGIRQCRRVPVLAGAPPAPAGETPTARGRASGSSPSGLGGVAGRLQARAGRVIQAGCLEARRGNRVTRPGGAFGRPVPRLARRSRLATPSAHHRHELLEVDLAVAVLIHILHELGDVPHGDGGHVAVAEDQRYLLLADPAVAVAVKDAEGGPADVLLQVHLPVQGGGQELGVVYHAGAVGVHLLEDLLQVWGNVIEARFGHAVPELRGGQQTVAVVVERGEGVSQDLNLGVAHLARDDVECSLLQLVL
mmetsp:Transcript_10311/g.27997  ORF Transcript_10311/g.27997 Transcript_10311/m.27997 type:complete len:282 (+) Transcript_10311:83-928(+)